MEGADAGRDTRLSLAAGGAKGKSRTAVRSRRFANAMPLSPIQEAAWSNRASERLEGRDLVQAIGTLREAVDPERLGKSWQRVVSRHPGLRIGIRWEGVPEPIQEVYPEVGGILEYEDWSDRPEAERQAQFEKWLLDDRAQGFELDKPPLVRLRLFRFSEREYRVVWTYHRILLDMRSAATVIREALDGPEGEPSTALKPASAEDLKTLRGAPNAQSYWRATLRGLRTPTPLGIDRGPETAAATRGWAEEERTLPAGVGRTVRELAASQGTTLETLLQGVWALLLHRYTGEPDVWIGVRSPAGFDGSDDLEAEPVGNSTNILPVRIRIDESSRVRHWLRSLEASRAAARPFQRTPLSRIQGWSELEPGLPLFRSLLVLEGARLQTRISTRGAARARDFRLLERTGCPVMIACHSESELTIRLVYESDRIEEGAAARMLGHFAHLLEAIAESPDSRLAALPLMSDAEIGRLDSWNNDTRTEVPPGRVTDWIEAQVACTPDRIAVAYGDSAWTYYELDRFANQVARHLRRRGLAPGARVGLMMDPSLHMVAGLLGILKAGAAYVPLDPELPAQRLEFMMCDAALSQLVTEQRLLSVLPASAPTPIFLDSAWPTIGAEDDRSLDWPSGADPDAYVIYTSGSTGQPKGVCVPHSALANLLWAMRSRPGLSEADVLIGIATISFDIAGLELFLPLITGARLVLVDRRVATDARALAEAIAEIRPTVLQATPSLWRMLLEAGWEGDPGLKVICGGEVLSRELATRLSERCGSVWNGYGPTEATIYSTMHLVEAGTGPVPIGRPVANTSVYVLDPKQRLLPEGLEGELTIGGAGVARGYLNRPELMAEKFIASPWAGGGRLYRTGDLARHLPDGSLEYLGRTDDQVKIRGFRIELGEIEFALSRHPSVRQSVVVARHDGRIARRLVAYLVVDRHREPRTEELRAFLSKTLPDYMVPAAFVHLDALPLTPSGKVDRRALPAPGGDRPDLAAALATPVEESERLLVRIWESVLRVKPIGIHDNFFDLGGDSLLALRLFTRIEKLTGKKLPLATLLDAPTVSKLAPYLSGRGSLSWRSLVTIQQGEGRPRLFCVPVLAGNAVGYRALARLLGPDQPVYVLQALGLDGSTEPLLRVEDMAAHYIWEIQSAGFRGPFHLAGASFGGLVVFEMARQLEAAGEEVGIVALFDTEAPRIPAPRAEPSVRRAFLEGYRARALFHLRRVFLEPEFGKHIFRIARVLARRARTRAGHAAYRFYERYAKRLPEYLRNVEQAGYFAECRYAPSPAPVEIQLFRATVRPVDDSGDPLMGWGRLAENGVTVIDTVADHRMILHEPAARDLAVNLRRLIDDFEKASRKRPSGANP